MGTRKINQSASLALHKRPKAKGIKKIFEETRMVAICFVSDKPKNLSKVLAAFSERFENETLVIVDTPETHAANAKAIAKAKAKKKVHLNQALLAGKTDLPAFGSGYGPACNAALAAAASVQENCIFVDDDTEPANDWEQIFEKHFSKGRKIVAGKYLGRTSHEAESLFMELCAVMSEYEDSVLPQDTASEEAKSILKGQGRRTINVDFNAGLTGGCVGISAETAREYPFMPTDYHSEVWSYEALAEHYAGRNAVYNEFTDDEPPIVFHYPGVESESFAEVFKMESKGKAVTLSAKRLLEDGRDAVSESEANAIARSKAEEYWEKLCRHYLHDQETGVDYPHAARDLGIESEFGKLYDLTPSDLAPSGAEAAKAINAFFRTQEGWEKMVSKARKEKWFG